MIKDDYVLNKVEDLGKKIVKILFKVNDDPKPIVIENLADRDILVITLKKMIS